jgi:hypothetical protein
MASTETPKQNDQTNEMRRLKRILSPDLVEVLGILKAIECDLLADAPNSVPAR